MDPIDALRQLEDRLHADLMQNPTYVALVGVRRAIRETLHLSSEMETMSTRPVTHTVRIRERALTQVTGQSSGVSQADAAYAILDESIEPLPISELVPRVRGRGATVGGANPEINLSSSLSRDGRFGSIRFKGRPCWVIKNKTYVSSEAMEPTSDSDKASLMGGDVDTKDETRPLDAGSDV